MKRFLTLFFLCLVPTGCSRSEPTDIAATTLPVYEFTSGFVKAAEAARNIARNLGQYHGYSALFALLAGIGGLTVSDYPGCSAGAAISLILAVIFTVTFIFRKGSA